MNEYKNNVEIIREHKCHQVHFILQSFILPSKCFHKIVLNKLILKHYFQKNCLKDTTTIIAKKIHFIIVGLNF